MKASLQAKCARQAREIGQLLEENETLRTVAAVETQMSAHHRDRAEAATGALMVIRQKLNVPGHEHVLDSAGRCALCRKRVPGNARGGA